jgi:hypothetical protein
MVSGLVIASDTIPYFSRIRNNVRSMGSNNLLVALLKIRYHDTDWGKGGNYHIMPEQLITWPVESLGEPPEGLL